MKTLASFLVLTVTLSGFVLADPPAAEETPADPLLQFRRDQQLVQALVEGGLDLAAETDPLTRAGTCNRLAKEVSRSIEEAAGKQERTRATVLAQHLETMLVRGVAFNAQRAKGSTPISPARVQALKGLLGDMDRYTGTAEEGLKRMAASLHDTGEATLRPLQQGRQEVRRAVEGDGPLFIPPGRSK